MLRHDDDDDLNAMANLLATTLEIGLHHLVPGYDLLQYFRITAS